MYPKLYFRWKRNKLLKYKSFFLLIDEGIISVTSLEVINNFSPIGKRVIDSNSLVLKINNTFPLINKTVINLNSLVSKISNISLLKNINNSIFKP